MDHKTQIVFEQNLDEQFVSDLNSMRQMRLGILKSLLQSPEKAAQELIKRGILSASDIDMNELQEYLTDKVYDLEDRKQKPHRVHMDDLQTYVNVMRG